MKAAKIKIPTQGTAVVDVDRKKLTCFHFTECGSQFQWRAVVHINAMMHWQWCKSKEEAEEWCRSRIPKTFKRGKTSESPA